MVTYADVPRCTKETRDAHAVGVKIVFCFLRREENEKAGQWLAFCAFGSPPSTQKVAVVLKMALLLMNDPPKIS